MDLRQRKQELEAELAKGEALLRQHAAQLEAIKQTMASIRGALALLQELEERQRRPTDALALLHPEGEAV